MTGRVGQSPTTMSNFSFTPLEIKVRANCVSPVAASVRKSEAKWINIRILGELVKKANFKPGEIVTTFIDKPNRALLFVTGQRPVPPGSRKIYGKDAACHFDLPRQGVLAEWFPQGPIRGMILVESSHGRIVIQVPKV